jgi:hypothetical protein
LPFSFEEKKTTTHRAFRWKVMDDDRLVEYVGMLMLGHFHHVSNVLTGLSAGRWTTRKAPVERAIEELSKTDAGNLENRDGWLFQFVSWIALALRTKGKVLLEAPHPMPSQKGFDGLAVRIADSNEKVEFVLLTEDKATENPRPTFLNQVVPEIEDIERGSRENQILTGVTTLVRAHTSDAGERQRLLESSLFGKTIRYRVCIATSESELPKTIDLFKGFDDCVSGDIERRGGEVLLADDVRNWLQQLADRVVEYLNELPKK